MKLNRTGVRLLLLTILMAAVVLASGRAAQADCGRSAANEARPAFREAEANPPKTAAEARAGIARLAENHVLPCPDDATAAREADYQVFIAWRRTLDARSRDVEYRATYSDTRCAPVRRAMWRAALAEAYSGAFTRAFASTKASPDATHVVELLRRDGRMIGLTLPPPYTVRNVDRPLSLEPISVHAHLPRGVICGT
jgi:hypothetical protein